MVHEICRAGYGGAGASVTITVAAVNDAPVATDDSLGTQENTALTFGSAILLANDSDIDGDVLSLMSFTQPTNGTLTYTPVADFAGTDSFTYLSGNGSANSNEAMATISVEADVTGSYTFSMVTSRPILNNGVTVSTITVPDS